MCKDFFFAPHPSFTPSVPKASWPGYKEGPLSETELKDLMLAWFDRWIALVSRSPQTLP